MRAPAPARALLLAMCCLLATAAKAQQQFPSLEKGVQADKLYHFGEIDQVNAFNGNLIISLPIGLSYPIDGAFSYQLTLSYNSKVWDQKKEGAGIRAYPSKRSNAGLGWTIGMGRFWPSDAVENFSVVDLYESPDGSDHIFQADGTTKDGSHLRLRTVVAGSVVDVDFPDGVTKRFSKSGGTWNLTTIWGPRRLGVTNPDSVTFTQPTARPEQCAPTATSWWVIADSQERMHYLCYKTLKVDAVDRPMIQRVVVTGPANTTATYQFEYAEEVSLVRPSEDTDTSWTGIHTVPLLTAVTLPDESKFTFSYHDQLLNRTEPELRAVTLPTSGKIEYTYQTYGIPALELCSNVAGMGVGTLSTGVATRTIKPRFNDPSVKHTWQYDTDLYQANPNTSLYQSSPICPSPIPENPPVSVEMWDEFTVTITDPLGGKVKNHYSVWPHADASPAGYERRNHAFPYGTYDAVQNRYLSQEIYDAAGVLKRSIYVRHHRDHPDFPDVGHRTESERVFHHDTDTPSASDGTACNKTGTQLRCTGSDSSGWDGYGHFRTITSVGNFVTGGNSRTVTTTWNMLNGVPRVFSSGDAWILNLYESITAEENGLTARSEYCFDFSSGFLERQRTLRRFDGVKDSKDLVTELTMDTASGNLNFEAYYGGDYGSVPVSGNLCDITLATPRYQLKHIYRDASDNPVRQTHYMPDPGFLSIDQELDPGTWLITKERDSAGVLTEAVYDPSGRLKVVKPTGRAWTVIDYLKAGTQPASVTVTQYPNGLITGPSLTSVSHEFDGYGRPVVMKQAMPDDVVSRVETTYDALGRRQKVSELGSAVTLPATSFQFDFAGRVTSVTSPDTSVTTYEYTNDRLQTRTAKIALAPSGAPADVQTTETYDSFGRLIAVKEKSGPTSATAPVGAEVTTEYGYDVANRLTTVKMKGVEGSQSRIQNRYFDYDGRGFLRWESHPESALTSYTYDARGHVVSKAQGGGSQYDLNFAYDNAERLAIVSGRNPLFPGPGQPEFRELKSFSYATANEFLPDQPGDWRKGRLLTATRYNYGEPGLEPYLAETYVVDETYKYDAAGRRRHKKTAVWRMVNGFLNPVQEFDQSTDYNDLDQPALMKYPKCLGCGLPSIPERNLTPTYDKGRVTSLASGAGEQTSPYVTSTEYWPNGMWRERVHANTMVDRQDAADDGNGIARPAKITSEQYLSCTAPVITVQPVGVQITSPTQTVSLSVTATGSGPLSYQWYRNNEEIAGATQSTYNVTPTPTVSTDYSVKVTNACRSVISAFAVVSVNECVPPQIYQHRLIRNVDGTVQLEVFSWNGTDPLTFTWRRTADNALVGTGLKIQVGPLSSTTAYYVTATNPCSATVAREDFVVEVPLPVTSSGLQATATGNTTVSVTWPASAGAGQYVLERRSNGGPWQQRAVIAAPGVSFSDSGLTVDRTYAYRIYATDLDGGSMSLYSNADVATTGTLHNVQQSAGVRSTDVDEVLRVVNLVRAVSGWPALTWATVLSERDPLPVPGDRITAAHLMSCRARMNEAVQALGVLVSPYTDPDLKGKIMAIIHINELLDRAR